MEVDSEPLEQLSRPEPVQADQDDEEMQVDVETSQLVIIFLPDSPLILEKKNVKNL